MDEESSGTVLRTALARGRRSPPQRRPVGLEPRCAVGGREREHSRDQLVKRRPLPAFATARQGFKDEAVQLLVAATFQPYGEIAVMRADGSETRILTDNSTEE